MRAGRLLALLILLQLRGRLSAAALAREFEVCVRTIYRDVEALSASGVPVYAERGRAGGFALVDGFETRLTGFTAREADALALIGVAQAAQELGFGEQATSARLKLLASLPRDAGAGALRVAARFHLDPIPWYGRRAAPAALRPLAEALWSDRRVHIRYESWQGTGERTIAPLGLVLKAGDWYVVAARGASLRTYRVAAIGALRVLDDTFARPRDFDLARHWAAATRAFEDALRGERAHVRLSPEGRRLLRDAHPVAADAVDAQAPAAGRDGWVEATIPVERGPHAVRELLRLGDTVEVLAPAALRDAVAAEAAALARRHRAKKAGATIATPRAARARAGGRPRSARRGKA